MSIFMFNVTNTCRTHCTLLFPLWKSMTPVEHVYQYFYFLLFKAYSQPEGNKSVFFKIYFQLNLFSAFWFSREIMFFFSEKYSEIYLPKTDYIHFVIAHSIPFKSAPPTQKNGFLLFFSARKFFFFLKNIVHEKIFSIPFIIKKVIIIFDIRCPIFLKKYSHLRKTSFHSSTW